MEEMLIKTLFIEKSIIFRKRNAHKLSIKKLNALACSCLASELVGPIAPELWFHMFCSLLLKKVYFFKKKDRLITTRIFWIVTVQEWPKTNPANTYCPLGTTDFSNVVDIDNLLVENSK